MFPIKPSKCYLIGSSIRKTFQNCSNRWIKTDRCVLAKDNQNVESPQSTKPPLKFSESAAFVPRRERDTDGRPPPSTSPVSFWDHMMAKRVLYKGLNRVSFMASLFAFMIYFYAIREENDIDEELTKPLWERLPSLEEKVLHERITLGKNRGEDVSEYERRYDQLLRQKQQEEDRILGKQS